MHYISTRGENAGLGFTGALLAGLARDGGLYTPEAWPALSADAIASFAGMSYASVAQSVIAPFVGGDIAPASLKAMIGAAYKNFRHAAVAPLVQLGDNLFVLELFHGPTLAFKDAAMQLLGRMMQGALKSGHKRATIIGATSGDTGAAAIEAFRGLENVDVFILYPHGRVSDVQRRQMTTVDAPNIHAVALDGTFDDCQNILKALFNHHSFRDEFGLSGVNSINWARIVAQIVYFFTSAVALGAPHRKVSFAVPTGNFGDVFAGYVAWKMGAPIARLLVATNSNDILTRAIDTGVYARGPVHATMSPAMDIQVASNFERLIFEAHDRDGGRTRDLMAGFAKTGSLEFSHPALAHMRGLFATASVDEHETLATVARVFKATGRIVDPHTAVGLAAADRLARPEETVVTLATAHPAKFPDAIEKAIGQRPSLPSNLQRNLTAPERYSTLANDAVALKRQIAER